MDNSTPEKNDQNANTGGGHHLWVHALSNHMPAAAFFVVDHNFRYSAAGGSALATAGLTSADFEGKHVADVVPADMLEQYLADYRAIFEGKPFTREHPVGERFYTTHGKLIKGTRGSRDAALAISYDITHERDHDSSC